MYNEEVIIPAFLRQAAKGNVIAIKGIFDRIEGKAKQIFDVDFVTLSFCLNGIKLKY